MGRPRRWRTMLLMVLTLAPGMMLTPGASALTPAQIAGAQAPLWASSYCRDDDAADTTSSTSASPESDTGTATAGLTDLQRKVAQAYADAGYSRASTAGVMGNITAESGWNPALGEKGGAGYGLAQWTPRSKIRAWFDANGLGGTSDSDADGQIRMLVATARSAFNDHYYKTVTNIDKKDTLLDTWLAAPDARTAVIAYMAGWERPDWGQRHEDVRVSNAQAFYDAIGGIGFKTPDGQAPADSTADTGPRDETGEPATPTAKECTADTGQGGPDPRIDDYMDWALKTADDDTVGYSMDVGSRLLNPDVDCSSFVYYALTKGANMRLSVQSPFATDGMGPVLQAAGFVKVGDGSTTALERGDILLKPLPGAHGHTELALGDGRSVGAHSPRGHPQGGDQDGTEVSVVGLWSQYTEVWRLPHVEGDGGGEYGEVGGAPADRDDFGWMCDSVLKVCKDGDYGTPAISWNAAYGYQCYWYWLARSYMVHHGDIQNPMTMNGGDLADEVGTRPGWTKSDTPRPGAGVCFRHGKLGNNHVAFVEKVESDPSGWKITYSEGNHTSRHDWHSYHVNTVTKTQYLAGGGVGFFWKNSWNL